MSNAWSHLPNAHHIDWVLESLKDNPELWAAAWDVTWTKTLNEANDEAWDATQTAARTAIRTAARTAAQTATRTTAWDAAMEKEQHTACGALAALVAYDDCEQFINMPYEQLQVWASLSEDPRAVLLLPMVYINEYLNEQCMVTPA